MQVIDVNVQTSTDYRTAYLQEKARADELRKMLDDQIVHTWNACRESDALCLEINRLLGVVPTRQKGKK